MNDVGALDSDCWRGKWIVAAKLNEEVQRTIRICRQNEAGFLNILVVHVQVYVGVRILLHLGDVV